ncbi:MAG TPA: hypothetical protein VGO01_24175 [Bradyrhizobium sp.]|nr:hypothetical protein [Bradyrhizobium sp.]
MKKQKTSKAFEKIKAGLGEARVYLDGSADKREYRVHKPAEGKVDAAATRAQQRPEDTT